MKSHASYISFYFDIHTGPTSRATILALHDPCLSAQPVCHSRLHEPLHSFSNWFFSTYKIHHEPLCVRHIDDLRDQGRNIFSLYRSTPHNRKEQRRQQNCPSAFLFFPLNLTLKEPIRTEIGGYKCVLPMPAFPVAFSSVKPPGWRMNQGKDVRPVKSRSARYL